MAGRLSAKVYRLGQRQVRHAVQDHHGNRGWRGKHDIMTISHNNSTLTIGLGLGREKILVMDHVNLIKKFFLLIHHCP